MAADVAQARPPLPHHVGAAAVGCQAFPSLPKVAVAGVWTTAAVTHTFPSLVPLDPLRPPAPLNCRLVHADYKFCYKTKHISIILLTSFCHVTMGYITS